MLKAIIRRAISYVFSFFLLFPIVLQASTALYISFTRQSVGIVAFATDGQIPGATVTAFGPEGYGIAATDENGHFTINQGLKSGNYTVTVVKEGYVNAERYAIAVSVGSVTPEDFLLTLSGGIHGRVLESPYNLTGLANVTVIAIQSDGTQDHGWTTTTDSNGNYTMATNLPASAYNITAVYVAGYVPNSVALSVVAGVMLEAPDLFLDHSGSISGRVADSSDNPIENAKITAVSSQYQYSAWSNSTGHYKISTGLGVGEYNVTASYLGYHSSPRSVSLLEGQEVNYFDLQITIPPQSPTGAISGIVSDMGGDPLVGVQVMADGGLAGTGQTVTDIEGRYFISSGLGSGAYSVNASAIGYTAQTIYGVAVVVNQTTSHVDFNLSKIPPEQSGTVSGTVTGEPGAIPESPLPMILFVAAATTAIILRKVFSNRKRHMFTPRSQ